MSQLKVAVVLLLLIVAVVVKKKKIASSGSHREHDELQLEDENASSDRSVTRREVYATSESVWK